MTYQVKPRFQIPLQMQPAALRHGTHEYHQKTLDNLRTACKNIGGGPVQLESSC
jgi:hypothetical protein